MTVWIVVVLSVIAAVIWKVTLGRHSGAKFVARVTGPGTAGIVLDGEVPGYGRGDFVEFLAGLELPVGAQIWGIPDRGRLILRFAKVPEGPQQRVRNLVLSKFR